MRIALIEDNQNDSNHLVQQLSDLGHNVIHIYNSFQDASKELCELDIDLIVTDYLLENGKTARDILDLKGLKNSVKIIVVTEFYKESVYEELNHTRPFFFLEKGSHKLQMRQAVDYLNNSIPILGKSKKLVTDTFYVKNGETYKSLNALDVYYFEVDGKYVNINLKERKFAIRSTLTDFESRLSDDFIRVHAAYIVNKNKIISFKPSNNEIHLTDNMVVPFSRSYRKAFIDSVVIA